MYVLTSKKIKILRTTVANCSYVYDAEKCTV